MYKKRIVNFSIIILLLAGLFTFSLITEQQKRYNARVNATSTIQKVRNFEDLTAGRMSATAFDNSFYNGEIVADGKITTTQAVKIDGNTLGIRVLGSDPRDRYITIQVAGYTKILIDIMQDSADTSISTGCGLSFSGKTLTRDIEIPTYGYHEIILTFKVPSNLGESAIRVMGIDNIRFYGIGDGSSSGSSSSSQESSSSSGTTSNEPPSSNPDVTRENTPPFIGTMVTMRGIADFLETKENHYPLSNAFIKDYSKEVFEQNGIFHDLKEVFYTISTKGVIRALHFQVVMQQPKLVRCVKGHIFDVIVDLRQKSKTYKQWLGFDLTGDNMKQLLIPAGFAHGYLVIEDSIVSYKCSEKFYGEFDSGILWNDSDINVEWPINLLNGTEIILSDKDKMLPTLRQFLESPFPR